MQIWDPSILQCMVPFCKIQYNKTVTLVGLCRHTNRQSDIQYVYFYLPLLFPNSTGTEQSSMCIVCSIPSACALHFLQWLNNAWIGKEHIICMCLFLKKKKCTINNAAEQALLCAGRYWEQAKVNTGVYWVGLRGVRRDLQVCQ